MRGRVALAVLIALAAACPAEGGEEEETERQREILRELETFRPSWVQPGGAWMLETWDTDAGLPEALPRPASAENAASRFRLLEDFYAAEAEALRRGGEDTRGVQALLEAAEMGQCRFIPEYYPEFDSTEAKQPDFKVLRDYLQGLLRRGERSLAAGDNREAERCYRAALACGRHLTGDRSSSIIFVTGLIFKMRGAQGYAGYLLRAGRGEESARVKAYADRLTEIMRAFTWKSNVALSEFHGFACLPAVTRIAAEDAEAFWRKEAVVRLATLRYGVPDAGGDVVERSPEHERVADEALSRVAASDPDVTVRRLAIWAALNVTPRDYARMEHRFQ